MMDKKPEFTKVLDQHGNPFPIEVAHPPDKSFLLEFYSWETVGASLPDYYWLRSKSDNEIRD
jgi:hypothetical protein